MIRNRAFFKLEFPQSRGAKVLNLITFLCRILFHTTQPTHVITIAAILFVASVLVPTKERAQASDHPYSRTTSFIYLASFVIHFGAQIWMTFISGNIEIYRSKNRVTLSSSSCRSFYNSSLLLSRSILILCIAKTRVRWGAACSISEIFHHQRVLESHHAPHIRQTPSGIYVGRRNRYSGV